MFLTSIGYAKFRQLPTNQPSLDWFGPPSGFSASQHHRADPEPIVAFVWKTEEKGFDVNLGEHLVRDGFLKNFEVAAILTNDTDLTEPVRIVADELKLPVVLLTPVSQPAKSLTRYDSDVRHIDPYPRLCQFPDPVVAANGKLITKPPGW